MKDTLKVSGTLLEVFRSKGIGAAVSDDLDCTKGLVKYLDAAKVEIVFAIFSLASQPIADALIRAHQRGVNVYGLADTKQWSGINAVNDQVVAAGIDLERAVHQHACMHLKVALIDRSIVATGSFNWTNNAEAHNDEVLLINESTELVAVLLEQIVQARTLNNV
jgi:phosphatidylserine/phosphatidylglycerophosphate/cardiolipin synthase-like enzyme